jgi:ribosomal-protein-alanine N-acetyltransferase
LVVVADDNGSVSAFIVARVVGEEWEIENVVVATPLRRCGIASTLMCNLVERARAQGAQQIMLEVRESNISARTLYAKCGFVECGRRERYYQDPKEDAVCYRLKVSSDSAQP